MSKKKKNRIDLDRGKFFVVQMPGLHIQSPGYQANQEGGELRRVADQVRDEGVSQDNWEDCMACQQHQTRSCLHSVADVKEKQRSHYLQSSRCK